jgi:signal transduction histidine kinase
MNGSASMSGPVFARSVDSRMVAAMRLVLASSALLIIYLDPSEPDRFVPITYAALVLYTLYSAALYIIAMRQGRAAQSIERWWHWADVGWYQMLIALSSGTSSIFYFFFLFSILVASFRWGFRSGLLLAVVSSILFTIIGYATAPAEPHFELNRFLLRPIYLVVLGYMMAYWGGQEITLKRRLAMLKEVSLLSNPRFGVDRTLGMIIEKLRAFYDAEACVLMMRDLDTGEYRLRRAESRDPESGTQAEVITENMARQLLTLPEQCAAICNGRFFKWRPGFSYHVYDLEKGERVTDAQSACDKLESLFDTVSIATVPMYYRNEVVGRLYIASQRRRAFDRSDAGFLIHVFGQLMPVIDNIRLVDRLASDAAEQERQRIARDIHDSVIQPYVGLQMGLSAISKKVGDGNLDVNQEIRRLIELTDLGISDLRSYVTGLKETGEHEASLVAMVRRFAAKFAEATNITVEVEAESDVRINDRLAAEAFQMIAEGLSNVRRHTQASSALIRIWLGDGQFRLRIENESVDKARRMGFTPRSIKGRAEALGGEARVEDLDDRTAVVVEIPL